MGKKSNKELRQQIYRDRLMRAKELQAPIEDWAGTVQACRVYASDGTFLKA